MFMYILGYYEKTRFSNTTNNSYKNCCFIVKLTTNFNNLMSD